MSPPNSDDITTPVIKEEGAYNRKKNTTTQSTTNQPKKWKIIESEEVKKHNKANDAWVVLNGGVYDITSFISNHPGGEEILVDEAGKNITEIFFSSDVHSHSTSALETLHDFRIGTLETGEDENGELFDSDNKLSSIIDLDKAIVSQMWRTRLPLADYLRLTHTPHFTKNGKVARLFENDFLELCSRNPWYVVLIWIPVSAYLFYNCALTHGFTNSLGLFTFGILFWSLLEYLIHRFIFHMDGMLPDHHIVVCLHFLLHGVHHFLPMDRMRLVFPPTLASVVIGFFLLVFHSIAPAPIANGLVGGGMFGYILYDLTHYYVHHSTPTFNYFKQLKTYHLNHHYKNYHLGYGVSSKFWDLIFNTVLRI